MLRIIIALFRVVAYNFHRKSEIVVEAKLVMVSFKRKKIESIFKKLK